MISFENTILFEYRDVIDNNFIVSKTDRYGRITYVNELFTKISGYEPHELIGKPHSIVRHPSMPSAVFSYMWDTILAKKTWRGRVTNKAKDGNSYIVESVIAPILDADGEIKEFIAIRYDVSEYVETGRKLREAEEKRRQQELEKESLEKINTAKDSFLLIFTHELKTPLNAVISFSDYICDELKGKGKEFEELVELARTIRQSGMFMLETVSGLLDLGRLKTNKLTFVYEKTNINAIIQKMIDQNAVMINQRSLHVSVVNSLEQMIVTDPNHFSKIIGNLISNAVKYSKSQILITLKGEKNRFELYIEDDGSGVPEESREIIFELFEQAEDTHLNRKAKGTGVGLHFVKLLCEEMHYSIILDSSPLLRGARFSISGLIDPQFS